MSVCSDVNNEDATLMEQLSRGDCGAFEKLYGKYFPVVRSFLIARRCDPSVADDLAQEVFTRLWQKRENYRDLSNVKTYICAIAKNVLARQEHYVWRETVVQAKRAVEMPRTPLQDPPAGEMQTPISESGELLRQAISKLSDKQQQAIELVYFLRIPIAEAAALAECSGKIFCERVYSAHRRLQQLLAHVPSIRRSIRQTQITCSSKSCPERVL